MGGSHNEYRTGGQAHHVLGDTTPENPRQGLLARLLSGYREVGWDKDMVEFHGGSFSRLGSWPPGREGDLLAVGARSAPVPYHLTRDCGDVPQLHAGSPL